jgi:hypothetical protein
VQGLPSLTVIVVRLPLSYKEPDEGGNNKDDKPHANLLVVDDDSDIAYVLRQGLLKDGFFWLVPLLVQKRLTKLHF